MLQNQPMDSLKWFCVLLHACQVFQWLTFVMILYFHSTEAITSVLLYILSHVLFFFNKYFVLCWNCIFVYTCDAGVLKVIIFSNVRVLFCDFYYAPGIGSLVYSILKNGPLHPFLTFSNSETKNKFLTFFGEKIGRGNSNKSLTW